jgi:Transglycosylase SLT domain
MATGAATSTAVTATPLPPPAPTPADPAYYVIGDSIGQGVASAGNIPGNTQIGAAPSWVLDQIQKNSDAINGKHVYLSSGAINNPGQINLVDQQLAALKKAGASDVTLLGVGNKNTTLNATLEASARNGGYKFAGGFDAGRDGIHPADYGGYYKSFSSPSASPSPSPSPTDLPSNLWTLPRFQRGILAAEGSGPTAVNSTSGARGSYQVLPSTARDPGFGITPAKDPYDFNELNSQFGPKYSEAMFSKYGPIMGAAAYNWGPGNVDKLLASAGDPRTGKISMDDWVSKLPSSVQHYVHTVAGGDLSLPAQVKQPSTTIATAVSRDATPGVTTNQLSMPTPPDPVDMKKMWAMMAMQSLLPKGFAFHPVEYPLEKILAKGRAEPATFQSPGAIRPVTFGSGQGPSVTAISPEGVPGVGGRGRRRE